MGGTLNTQDRIEKFIYVLQNIIKKISFTETLGIPFKGETLSAYQLGFQ